MKNLKVKRFLNDLFVSCVWLAYIAALFYLSMAVLALFVKAVWPAWFIVAVSLSGIYIAYVIYVLTFYKGKKKTVKKSR